MRIVHAHLKGVHPRMFRQYPLRYLLGTRLYELARRALHYGFDVPAAKGAPTHLLTISEECQQPLQALPSAVLSDHTLRIQAAAHALTRTLGHSSLCGAGRQFVQLLPGLP